MKTIINLSTILFLSSRILFAQTNESHDNLSKSYPVESKWYLEIPKVQDTDEIIYHTGFSLLYSEEHEQASWVAYELTKEETVKSFEREDQFRVDPLVKSGSATNKDYLKSGYDKGHLAPAADMSWSERTLTESFYLSNMSPQVPSFNRGIWKKLEGQVRTWAVEYQKIYIVTGPVLKEGLKTIGENKVSVPEHYYKVILDMNSNPPKSIGFLLPNEGSQNALTSFAVPVDSVELVTGIDFFYLLEDKLEEKLESQVCLPCWSWGGGMILEDTSLDEPTPPSSEPTTSNVCKGVTQKGAPCKNKTNSASGYCYLHEDQQKSPE